MAMMRKIFLILTGIVLAATLLSCGSDKAPEFKAERQAKLVLTGPFAPVTYPLIWMVENNKLADVAESVEIKFWSNPDQLRALVAGKQADFFAVPTNVAAMFYNKGVDMKLLNVAIWRAIWMVSRSGDKKTLADFKGEEIVMPFKGDMPHIVFNALSKKQGIDPEKDFNMRYVNTPMDAAQQLIMRKADNALLIDPAVSTVLYKSGSFPVSVIAPELYRSVDIQNEWGRLYGGKNEIPFAGIAALSTVNRDTALVNRFLEEYQNGVDWCLAHPEETAKLAVKYIEVLKEEGVAEAMRHVTLRSTPAPQAKAALIPFFEVINEGDAAKIGGKLPDNDFYWGEMN